jgi:hypothetical protein
MTDPQPALPAPECFVARMADHWTRDLGNVASLALQAVWRQMAETFNAHISLHGDATAIRRGGEPWTVLQPPTGSGKSRGLAVYLSMLTPEDHPGALVVVRTIQQADEMAEAVNKLSGRSDALAYHSENKSSAEAMATFPVLVVCHRAYEMGLEAVSRRQEYASSWSAFHRWQDHGRALVVIDEALDIVSPAQVTSEQIADVLSVLARPETLRRYPNHVKTLRSLQELLDSHASIIKEDEQESGRTSVLRRERLFWSHKGPSFESVEDMVPLRRELRTIPLDVRLLRKRDPDFKAKRLEELDNVLRGVEITLSNWSFLATECDAHTLHSARLIVPEHVRSVVVLDATASCLPLYNLFGANILPVPAKARTYRTVRLHYSLGHAVGKHHLAKHAKDEAPRLIENLKACLPADRKVFIACHKYVEPFVKAYRRASEFTAFHVGHYGNLDGRNDFRECDVAVLFGIHRYPRSWSAATYMALKGPQSDAWLQSKDNAIRYALETGQITTSLVQAMNRIACRRVVSEDGDCPAVDIFVLLPPGKQGRDILDGIAHQMPDIQLLRWRYEALKKSVRKSDYEDLLVSHVAVMMPGKHSASEVRHRLNVSEAQWKRLISAAKDPASAVAAAFAAHGVRYHVEGAGRGARSYIIRGE